MGTNPPLEAADGLSTVSTIKYNSYCVSEVKKKNPNSTGASKCRIRCDPWGAPKVMGHQVSGTKLCMDLQRKGREEPMGRAMCLVGQAME